MRKYLWALALCGAAGMAVPSGAQERSKSLFGLGRSNKTATTTPEKSSKPSKPAKLKNYGELFGQNEKESVSPNAKAPSPAEVQRMNAEADAVRVVPVASASEMEENPFPTKDLTTKKAPASAKSSLLDDLDELDELEALDEAQEEAPVAAKAAPNKTVAADMPASEGRVIVRPQVKAKPPLQAASVAKSVPAEKPAWATESPAEDAVVAEFQSTPEKKVAPAIKQARVDVASTARPAASKARPVAVKPSIARAVNPRLNTPIAVIADTEEMAPTESAISTVAASQPAAPAPASMKSRLNVTRSTPRAADSSAAPAADATSIASTYSAPAPAKSSSAATQSPTVTVEWRSTGSVNVGQESSCELVIKNSGSVTAQAVEIAANFPANVRLVSTEPKPASDTNLVWAFDEIAPGDEKIVQVKFVPVERGEVAANASVRFTGAASTRFAVTEPLLSVKLEGTSEVMVGENASQTLIVSNPGTGTAANVKVEAIIPAGLEHARGERLLMELGNLAPGENRPIRLALTAVAGGRQVIEVHTTADNGLVQSAASEVTVIAPSLAASIEGPSLRYLGRHATYTLHVSNDGAAATDNVRVMHKIPEGFEFVSAERGAQYDPQNRMLNWFVGRLDRGAKSEVAVVLNAKTTGEFTHFVRATSEHGAISDSEVTTRIEGAASLVIDVLDLDDPVEVGVETAYEIRVKNEGTAPAQNVGLTCEMPAGMEFLTASGDSAHENEKELVVFQPVAEVAAGKTLTYRVKVKGTLSGNMRFRTKVSSDSLSEPLASEEMTKIYGE